ncbi:MAG: PTS sugar transporter subunit IIC [Clostridia bacterium]|nr:PTS sugar transporter subunit IIC [Clostridia bacterium]
MQNEEKEIAVGGESEITEEIPETAVDAENTEEKQLAETDRGGVKRFFKRAVKRYLIDAFSGMALGLFCTLIAGTIIGQIGLMAGNNAVGKIITNIGLAAKTVMGAGIGVGIAHSFKAKKLTMFTAAAAGMIGANMTNIFAMSGVRIFGASPSPSLTIGDPVAAYFAAVFCIEICSLVEGKTPVDIVLIPLLGIVTGSLAGMVLGIPFGILFALFGKWIAMAIKWSPILFGIIIAVIMGLLLTLPTSSAAFGVMLFGAGNALITPELSQAASLAAGAACAGCCAHMVGFAVASFRENKWGGLVSQGIGTSMLQIPNLAKNPRILLPAVIASAVCGPLSSAAFGLMCDASGSGMGTAGLVGVIQTFSVSVDGGMSWWFTLIGVLVCYILVPAAVALGTSELMRKLGWIKYGDMKLPK